MKKTLMFIPVIAMAVTVFVTTKSVSKSSNVDLDRLTNINTANAECNISPIGTGVCMLSWDFQYKCYSGSANPEQWNCTFN